MLFLKRNYLRLIGAEVRDSCGSSGTGETPQAFTPRRLTARPAESEQWRGNQPHRIIWCIATKYAKTAKERELIFVKEIEV
ncbi:hypothetical protein CN380_24765 [Bacillus sp. AFS017274]|nr:hypothetical protein CN380_24765 [Bacillus sp. AFS017274]